LIARGQIRLKPTTTSDLDRLPCCDVAAGVSPLELLLAARADDVDREASLMFGQTGV
jgi:hypothetical protein